MSMSFKHFSQVNIGRGNRWHKEGIDEWSISDWCVAMVGEAGECADAVKKLRRIETGAANKAEHQIDTKEEAYQKIGEEIADTVIYCDLLCHRLGISLEEVIKAKFNKTSERYGFPDRL